jgi:hypothetical protein
MSTCEHLDFHGEINVNRITEHEGGPVKAFTVDMKVTCAACGEPFVFLCPDGGVLPDRPAVSVDGQEIRLPIVPAGNPNGFRLAAGFRVNGPAVSHNA